MVRPIFILELYLFMYFILTPHYFRELVLESVTLERKDLNVSEYIPLILIISLGLNTNMT